MASAEQGGEAKELSQEEVENMGIIIGSLIGHHPGFGTGFHWKSQN